MDAETARMDADKTEQHTAPLGPGLMSVNEAIEMNLRAKVKKESDLMN
jgi:hypothetical protein